MLIAEDQFLVRQAIVGVVEGLGYEVAGEASDGKEAVDLVQSLRPDVVLMDIQMPEMDATEACRLIQEASPVPVVMLTAHDSEELVQQASEAGAGAYLINPPDPKATDRAIKICGARVKDLMEIRRVNEQPQDVLAQVDLLRGIIPICVYCKNIRDDEGCWERVDAYVSRRSAAEFSHSICPTCYEERFPELSDSDDER